MHVQPGSSAHLGPLWIGESLHLSLHAPNAHSVDLVLFEWGSPDPWTIIPLHSHLHQTGTLWHVALQPPFMPLEYAYRINGSPDLVGDPYAPLLGSRRQWRHSNEAVGAGFARGVLLPPQSFDWKGIPPPRIPRHDLVLYEAHLRAFTMGDPDNSAPGTFLGMTERLDHLQRLGVNALELMPIVEFDELEYHRKNPITGDPLCQFWGYSPQNFFAPMRRYSAWADQPDGPMRELQTLVLECHRRGICVILDLVYNHTAWPNVSWARIDPQSYYIHDVHGASTNYSGCGNTIQANHPITRRLILDSLRHFVSTYHIDGFRFDLTACLWRGARGELLGHAPLIEEIEADPLLREVLLIAEPWDAVGAYQVGATYSPRWLQWNGSFRDVTRRFAKGDTHQAGMLASRLCGSQDLFDWHGSHPTSSPQQSINFVTCHDGFTLADLVAYNHKHNQANGEENRDGSSHNDSWNCGVEGPTDFADVLQLRRRQQRKLLLLLLTAQGVPMLLMGDEVGLSRHGNNNTWCQDNALNAFPWEDISSHQEYEWIQTLLALRQSHKCFRHPRFLGPHDILFHGIEEHRPDWSPDSPLIAFTLLGEKEQFFLAFSRTEELIPLQLPQLPSGSEWRPLLHSSLPLAPLDAGIWVAERI